MHPPFVNSCIASRPSGFAPVALLVVATIGVAGCDNSTEPSERPAQLAFHVQPTNTTAGEAISPVVQVEIQDAHGNVVSTDTSAVTVALGTNPAGGALSGSTTVNAVFGIASFPDLRIDRAGIGYTLAATSGSLASATSTTFVIRSRLTFAQVSAGEFHTCGTTTEGVAYCWGWNAGVQLGDGTATERSSPVPVLDGLTFAQLSAGTTHTCGVTTGGAGYCWGTVYLYNGMWDSSHPLEVLRATFAQVSAGQFHTCGVTTGGAALCWGQDFPNTLVGDGITFAQVSAGDQHSCGVTTGGAAYCWGHNFFGQLGDGTTTDRTSPVPVLGGLSFAQVSAGGFQTCGVTTGGAAYCWGWNGRGQLGDGTTTERTSPVPVLGGFTFAQVSAGDQHSCGVTSGGAAYCWGQNFFGQLGNGTADDQRTSSVPVLGGLTFAQVSAGDQHTCGVTTGGAAYCWGSNGQGQLGDGSTNTRLVPTPVAFP